MNQEILSKWQLEEMERANKLAQREARRDAEIKSLQNQLRVFASLIALFVITSIAASYATVYYSSYQNHTHETAQNLAGLTIFVAALLAVASGTGAGLTLDRIGDARRYR